MLFEWDDNKEKINIVKHGIDFSTAAHVFQDENRIEFLMKCTLNTKTDTSPSAKSTV